MLMEDENLMTTKYGFFFYGKTIEIIIIILVILTPLVFCPYLIRNFNPIKELVFEILLIIGLAIWAVRTADKGFLKFTSSPVNLPILSFMAICIFSLFWSGNPSAGLLELPLFLAGPILYFVAINNINDKRQINHILTAILVIGALLGIYGILQYQGIDFSFWGKNVGRQQVFGLFGNVNYFAEYLIIPISIAVPLFFTYDNKIKKALLLIGILAMGITLILTFTRGSYLAFGIALIFMLSLFLSLRGKSILKKHKKIILIFLIAVIIVTLLFVIPNPLNKSGTVVSKIKARISIAQFTQGYSLMRRIAIWKFTTLMIKDHPLLGSGLGTFKYNSLYYQARFFNQGQNRKLYPSGFADKVHNEYLQFWVEIGIIGLAIFIWLIICYFNFGIRFLRKEKDKQIQGIVIGLMGAVMAVLADAIFGFPLHLPATIVLFWLVVALTVIIIKGQDEASDFHPNKKEANKEIKLEKKSSMHLFKYFSYLAIILIGLFLCIMVARPFVSKIYLFRSAKSTISADYNGAIKNYQEAIKWNPYEGIAYYGIGKILSERSLFTAAIENFEKAAEYIDHPYLPQNLGYLYLKKGQGNQAINRLKQAISYQTYEASMVPLYIDLGKLYLQAKSYDFAENAFKSALKINTEHVGARFGLANAYLMQNKREEGLRELEKVIELAPESQEAGYARMTIQKFTESAEEGESKESTEKETD